MINANESIRSRELFINIQSAHAWLPPTQTWMYNQIRYLPADMETHIVCDRTENLKQFGLPNIHSFADAPSRWFVPSNLLKRLHLRDERDFLIKKVRDLKAKVVHTHFGHIGWRNAEAVKKTGAKHIVSFYGFDASYLPVVDPLWHKRYSKLFQLSDCILCEGPFMAQTLKGLGCPAGKIRLQRLGIEVDRIEFKPRTWSPSETLRVLIAASFQEKKGIPYALEALGRLQHEADLAVTVIGDANDEARSKAEKEKILEVIRKYRLESRVRLLSYQPFEVLLHEAYRHHIFLSPSLTAHDGDAEGGLPVTILEMAATGMMVVASRHCDIPEAIHHGAMGLLAGERDVDGIVSHLRWLLNNPDKWHGMAVTCRQHMEEAYDVRKQAIRLAGIYRGLSE